MSINTSLDNGSGVGNGTSLGKGSRLNLPDRYKLLSGAQLKYIAFASMLIDHVNKALLYPNLDGGALNRVSDIMDILGRIAFPIFVFLMVEGFFKTRNRWRYLGTMLLFGVISEVPFDMFTTATFFDKNWNNIMFSLALAMATLWIVDELKARMNGMPVALWYVASFVVVGAMCLAAMNLGLDYDQYTILVAYFYYIFWDRPVIAAVLSALILFKTPWAVLGFALTLTYNGKRGKQYKIPNYLFYPVHMLILGIIRMRLGI